MSTIAVMDGPRSLAPRRFYRIGGAFVMPDEAPETSSIDLRAKRGGR
jgi:hypothetical protein